MNATSKTKLFEIPIQCFVLSFSLPGCDSPPLPPFPRFSWFVAPACGRRNVVPTESFDCCCEVPALPRGRTTWRCDAFGLASVILHQSFTTTHQTSCGSVWHQRSLVFFGRLLLFNYSVHTHSQLTPVHCCGYIGMQAAKHTFIY